MKIALFFTEGMSLVMWHHAKLVRRDSLLYELLCEAGHEVYFVTYGYEDDADYLPADSPIKVLTRPRGMGQREYSWKIHAIHRDVLRGVDVIKSHQVTGARYAAYAAWKLGKPFIARCGYLPSYFMMQENAPLPHRLRNWLEEFFTFHRADAICVPSQAEIDYLNRRYKVRTHKAYACPNWIDTDAFQPDPTISKNRRQVCFVGRFHPQKDPLLLLEALRGMQDVELLMIGGGQMTDEIHAKVAEYGIRARILPRVDNEALPRYLNESAIYALPTRYEGGSPKTLFEAMACGLPVVSTDGFGVIEAFEDGVQGYKIAVGDVAALRNAIQKLLDDPDEAQRLGVQARQHILDNYSVACALQREQAVLART